MIGTTNITLCTTFVLLLGLGCAPLEPEPMVQLGTAGPQDWQALEPEQPLELIADPEVGHHFLVQPRIRDLAPGDGDMGNPQTSFIVRVIEEGKPGRIINAEVHSNHLEYELLVGDWHRVRDGFFVVIQENELPDLYGQHVRLEIDVTDETGWTAHDEVIVIVAGENRDRTKGKITIEP